MEESQRQAYKPLTRWVSGACSNVALRDNSAPIACIYAMGAIISGIAPAAKGRGPALASQPVLRVPGLIRSVGYRYPPAG